MGWRHSGFNVFCGSRIQPGSEESMENLARYIIRASFSQERMTYLPEACSGKMKVISIIERPDTVIRNTPLRHMLHNFSKSPGDLMHYYVWKSPETPCFSAD